MGLGFSETMLLIALGCLMLFLMRNFKEHLLAKISYCSLGLALVMDFTLLW
jgi:inner membrane protein involved in colicin E2 resistance